MKIRIKIKKFFVTEIVKPNGFYLDKLEVVVLSRLGVLLMDKLDRDMQEPNDIHENDSLRKIKTTINNNSCLQQFKKKNLTRTVN